MHWIQTIRESLELSREELAHYLQLSVHTVVSVENDRRRLPIDSLLPSLTLFNIVKDCNTLFSTTEPLKEELQELYNKKKIPGLRSRELKKIQKAHTIARFRLGVYQSLVQALTGTNSKADRARLQWAQEKIKQTMRQIEESNI